MKLGVSLYSFREYAKDENLGVKGCIDKAKEIGFEGLDIVEGTCKIFADKDEYIAYAKDIGDYCKQVGIEAVCFCVGSDFLNGSGGDLQKEIDRVKDLVDVAAAYGVSVMRHDATPGYPYSVKTGRSFDAVVERLAAGYRAVTEYAATKGIKTCVENHGFFVQDPTRVEKLVNTVNHPNFGALVDMGNFACADANSPYSVGIMAPYAFHVHAKDFHIKNGAGENPGTGWFRSRGGNYLRGSIIGHGDIPVRQCINILKGVGYDGFINIEFEGMEDAIKGISVGYENLKRFCE